MDSRKPLPPLPPHAFLDVLGTGGMATVYAALDEATGREVAVKVLRPQHRGNAEVVARFIDEARLAARMSHPNLAPLFCLGTHPQHGPCFSMKRIDGHTLHTRMRPVRRTPKGAVLDELVDIVVDVCAALEHAHAAGVVHGDLKCQNVLLGEHGAVYLMDWGNAREHGSPAPVDEAGRPVVLGTLGLLSPEQARGEELDARTDVFGVGTMIYTLLARRVPYGRGGPQGRIDAAKAGRFEPLSRAAPKAPATLREICERAMQVDPDDRFQSVHALRQALLDYRRRRVDVPVTRVRAGDVLVREGDVSDVIYIVDEGRFEVSREALSKPVAEVGLGAVIGETGVLTDGPRTATVTALTDAKVRCLDRNRVEQELERVSPWIQEILRGLARWLREATTSA